MVDVLTDNNQVMMCLANKCNLDIQLVFQDGIALHTQKTVLVLAAMCVLQDNASFINEMKYVKSEWEEDIYM